jgi:hypothetical protein
MTSKRGIAILVGTIVFISAFLGPCHSIRYSVLSHYFAPLLCSPASAFALSPLLLVPLSSPASLISSVYTPLPPRSPHSLILRFASFRTLPKPSRLLSLSAVPSLLSCTSSVSPLYYVFCAVPKFSPSILSLFYSRLAAPSSPSLSIAVPSPPLSFPGTRPIGVYFEQLLWGRSSVLPLPWMLSTSRRRRK